MAHRSSTMPGVVHDTAYPGEEVFWRDGELLVVEEDADFAVLRSELRGNDFDSAAGVRRYRLPGREVSALVAWARSQPGQAPRVSVNHLYAAQHRPPWSYHTHVTYHFANFEAPRAVPPPAPAAHALAEPDLARAALPGLAQPVRVGLLDTAVDHPLLRERTLAFGQAPEQAGPRTDEAVGHGTLVAGLIAGRAPQAELVVTPVMDGNGVVEEFDVIQALGSSVLRTCQVLNISFAGYTADDQAPPALAAALTAFLAAGDVVAVAAAGNGGGTRPRWPAALPGVLAVGAVDADGTRWPHSAHGPWVDVWALGVDVTTTFVHGEWASWSGTSAAAAQVSGDAASHVAHGAGSETAALQLLKVDPMWPQGRWLGQEPPSLPAT